MRPFAAPLAALLAVAAAAPQPEAAARPGRVGSESVVIEYADGRRETRPAADLGALGRQPDGALEAVAVVFAPRPAAAACPAEERMELELVGGDRLAVRPIGGESETLVVELLAGDDGALLTLPIDALSRAVFPARVPTGAFAGLAAAAGADRLYLRVGGRLDRVDGTLESFSADGIAFDGIAGRRTHPWADVAAFYVAPLGEPPAPPAPAPGRVQVDLAGGSRIGGTLVGLSGDGVELETAGGRLALPLAALAELATDDGRLLHLGALPMARVDGGRPFGDDLGMVFAPRVDRAVHGEPLATPDGVVPRGIGVLAPTRVEFALDAAWQRLAGAVAVDASSQRLGQRGSVVFAIEVDGERRWESPLLRGGEAAIELPAIDLAGAARLALVTEDGGDGFAGDRADWLRVRLLR